jgi:uncharacterized membrane protein YfcA
VIPSDLEPWRWALGAACALMIGVAKTGAPGLAMLTVPLMVFTVGDARMAAAWTTPMLIVGDVFAVAYWRRQAEVKALLSLVPWVGFGMLLGGAALRLDDDVVRRVLATIILVMVGLTIASRRRPAGPPTGSTRHLSAYGVAAGFATTLANAAGPVMSAYLLLKRMPKEQLVATGAWFYLTVNIAKLPIYAANGLLSAESFGFDLVMAPLVAAGAIVGFGLLRRIPQRAFDVLTLGLAAASALALFR